MKKEIPVPTLIAIVAAVVVVLGLIGWKLLSPSGPAVSAKTAIHKKDLKDGGD